MVCERGVAKGLPVYPALLVNQGGGDDYSDTRTSDFWLENPHLKIGAKLDGVAGVAGYDLAAAANCVDFAHAEVRTLLPRFPPPVPVFQACPKLGPALESVPPKSRRLWSRF